MQAPEPPFPRYKSKRILCFAYLMCSSVSWPKALKKRCLRFVMFNFSEKLQNIFEIGFKKYFERKNSQTGFCCLCVNLLTVKIWGQSDKFPMNLSFSQCSLQVKKLIRENSAKYVNQTGNIHYALITQKRS